MPKAATVLTVQTMMLTVLQTRTAMGMLSLADPANGRQKMVKASL
jgi:hypothetical protein